MIKMPSEYIGKYLIKKQQDTITPREWTKEEEEWCWKMKNSGYSDGDIAYGCDRDLDTVKMKMNRLRQKYNKYNEDHVEEKYSINADFISHIKPKSVLDVYCGVKNFYKDKVPKTISNDKDKSINADYNMDALKFVCLMYASGKKFDVVDLDAFGTSIECFDIAIKMAKKGIVVTFGELSCKRYKRLDNICRHYDIYNLNDLTTENLIKNIKRKALKDKKELLVYKVAEWKGISRVWFEIKPINVMTCNIIDKVKNLRVGEDYEY